MSRFEIYLSDIKLASYSRNCHAQLLDFKFERDKFVFLSLNSDCHNDNHKNIIEVLVVLFIKK